MQLLNYRGNSKPFWNHLHIAPIRDNEGQLAHFVGLQLDVTDASGAGSPPKAAGAPQQPAATPPPQADAQPAAQPGVQVGLDCMRHRHFGPSHHHSSYSGVTGLQELEVSMQFLPRHQLMLQSD